MNAQTELPYHARHIGSQSWLRKLEVIRTAVNHLTTKDVADELGVTGAALSDAMNERDNKRWAAKWTSILIVMLGRKNDEVSDRMQRALLDEDADLTPYVVEARQVMTPKELAASYEREFARMGELGQQAMQRARRGGSKR